MVPLPPYSYLAPTILIYKLQGGVLSFSPGYIVTAQALEEFYNHYYYLLSETGSSFAKSFCTFGGTAMLFLLLSEQANLREN